MTLKTINRQIKALIVDDDKDVCKFLKRILEKRNYSVMICNDPREVSSLLNKHNFQIILLDIVMPKKDGIEVLKEIKEIDDSICVIIISAYPTLDRAFDSLRNEAFDFLPKPFTSEKFASTLDNAEEKYGLISNLYQIAVKQIAKKVSDLRSKKNLSLRQLANRSNLSPSLIYQIEHAESAPSLSTLAKLSSALQTNLSYFFEEL